MRTVLLSITLLLISAAVLAQATAEATALDRACPDRAPLDLTQEGIIGSSALLNAPYGLAFDSAGNLYISERNNHIIRMVRRWNDPSF